MILHIQKLSHSIAEWTHALSLSSRDVNETLRSDVETETFGFQYETRPRPRPCRFSRDRDRDRDVQSGVPDETETETLIGRDRDIFRDLGTLKYFCLA